MSDELGDRMKFYEGMETGRVLLPGLPILVRLDGRAFHTFTKNMKRPFSRGFSEVMVSTMLALVDMTNARIGYTQSDEISLIIQKDTKDLNEEVLFGGRIQKLVSVLSSFTTVSFLQNLRRLEVTGVGTPTFDCRVWNVPSRAEAVNSIVWRELDATKNSIQMAARAVLSHKEVDNKNTKQLQEMLFQQRGINWNDYPARFKRGTYARRVYRDGVFTPEEIEGLPPKHRARTHPGEAFTRSAVEVIELPRILSINNREAVLFDGAEPDVRANVIPTAEAET